MDKQCEVRLLGTRRADGMYNGVGYWSVQPQCLLAADHDGSHVFRGTGLLPGLHVTAGYSEAGRSRRYDA